MSGAIFWRGRLRFVVVSKISVRHCYVDALLTAGNNRLTATHLSRVATKVSHDQFTRLLRSPEASGQALLRKSTRLLKAHTTKGFRLLIVDDTIIHKPHSALSSSVGYHYDHSQGHTVRGINLLSAMWSDEVLSLPVMLQVVEKINVAPSEEKPQWVNKENKNELFRAMIERVLQSPNRAADYVLSDIWFASSENMDFIKEDMGLDFVMGVKGNRLVALTKKDADGGKWIPLQTVKLGKRAQRCYLKGLDFPVLVVREVFKNGDDAKGGTLYLACSDLEIKGSDILGLYQRRWKIEEYHRSLKQNCCVAGAQVYHPEAHRGHIHLAAMAFIRLERARSRSGDNHYELRREIEELKTKYAMKAIRHSILSSHATYKIAA